MVHLWSSPGVLYGRYAAVMYALFPCCVFCISCSLGLFCCTVRIFGAGSCRDFLRRSILPRKSTRLPAYSALRHCKGGRLCSRTPFWEAVLRGEMQLCVSSLLLRRDHGGRYVLNSMVCYQPCRSTTDSQSCWPAASMDLACRGGYATGWNQPQKVM